MLLMIGRERETRSSKRNATKRKNGVIAGSMTVRQGVVNEVRGQVRNAGEREHKAARTRLEETMVGFKSREEWSVPLRECRNRWREQPRVLWCG